mgnify:CR=1 FL=1
MELEINKKLIRKGISKEVYFVKDKKFVNNILHYIIKSKNSGDVILSKFAIEKDFFIEKLMSNHDKQNFANAFSDRIKKLLKYK